MQPYIVGHELNVVQPDLLVQMSLDESEAVAA